MKRTIITAVVLAATIFTQNCIAEETASSVGVIQQATHLAKEGKYDEALITVKDVLKDEPENYEANRLLGNLNFAKENYKEAIEGFNKLISQYPTKVRLYVDRAIAHFANGNDELALEDIHQAINMNPSNKSAIALRDKILEKLKSQDPLVGCKSGCCRTKGCGVTIKKLPRS